MGQGQGQSGEAVKLFQTPRKIRVLPYIFDTSVFHPSRWETCTVIQQQFWTKVCDIL